MPAAIIKYRRVVPPFLQESDEPPIAALTKRRMFTPIVFDIKPRFRVLIPPFVTDPRPGDEPPMFLKKIKAVPPIAFGLKTVISPVLSSATIQPAPVISPVLASASIGSEISPSPVLASATIEGGGGDSIVIGPISTISVILDGANKP